MLFLWLIVWAFSDFPKVEPWNGWFIGLIVCALLSLGGD